MIRALRILALAALAFCSGTPASAQATFPTTVGTRVPGSVPLQCDASGINCAPVSVANPLQVTGGSGGGAVTQSGTWTVQPGNTANTTPWLTTISQAGSSAVVQGIANGGGDGMANNGNTASLSTTSYGAYFNGTTFDRVRGDANGAVTQVGLSSTYWRYTSGTSPILSNTTTAVTIKTAAGASVRNYIDACQITTTAFGTSVPLAIRDGAGGSVMFALTVPTGGFLQPTLINFVPPLQGSANTLAEIVTTTANTSGTVTANCQGHTGP